MTDVMIIHDPPGRTSTAILPMAFLALCACGPAPPVEEGNATDVETEAPLIELPSSLPAPDPEMDRAGLLSAVAAAASAHAAGQEDSEAQAKLAGRRFTLRIRFGCKELEDTARPMSWSYDEDEQRLTIRANPDISEGSPLLGDMAEPVEAVEGFWIPRPWLLTDACPREDVEQSRVAAEPAVGIAQYFTGEDSRVQRRARRSYEIVRRTEPAIGPPRKGFNLVLSGRLRPWPGSGVIRCHPRGPNVRPACIVSAELDRVAFENPENSQMVAEWSAG